ncbi:MAG TPA: SpoIID/LytB domain-containing protein [Gaiellaceae bacterium]|nr:SpoIID/LytB domain-containing protein [Gaiellaceae bacterium]
MLVRSFATALAAAAVAAGSASAASVCGTGCVAAPAGSGALFLFSGHGWGHGVGMSQYGAYGYAQHGATYDQILAHYYPGTTLGPSPLSTIRVLLAERKKPVTITSTAPFAVRDAAGTKLAVPSATVTLAPTLRVRGRTLQPPLSIAPARGAALSLARPYRGRLSVDVVDGKLRVVNVVPLEQYLYGVVPAEMPSSWAAEALKAQAVAARSYAVATRQIGAPFDVYADTRSQMYLGLDHESPAATAAVDATKRQVVLYQGAVATTYFSSTSGGRTESAAAWTGKAVPYLVSVPDPYDDISPYHDWGPTPVTAQAIAKALKAGAPVTDATLTPTPTGRVATVTFASPLEPIAVAATKLRAALGLRSTWFSLSVMALAPPPGPPVAYGSSVPLGGLVRGLSAVTLEQRPAGGQWQPVQQVGAGPVRVTARPTATTDYRLATPAAAAGAVRVRVAPAVKATITTTLASGTVAPALPNAPLEIEQQNPDLTWTVVASGVVGADGSYSVPVELTIGATYRVTVPATTGLAAGSSAPQVVAG